MMKTTMIAVLFLVGCSKGGGGDAARCTEVANGAVDRMMGAMGGGAPPAELKAKGDALKGVLAKRCTEDKWSADVLDCYAKAGSMPDIRACRSKLPEAQSNQLQSEEMQAMMGGGGMPRPNVGELQKKLDALNASLAGVAMEVSNAPDDASRTAAREKLNTLQKQALVLREQIERVKAPPSPPAAPPAAQ